MDHKINSFDAFIRSLEYGRLSSDGTDMVRNIVAAIEEAEATGQKPIAELTLKVKFKKDSGVIEMTADITSKLPKLVRTKTLAYATPENNLTLNNPKQMELGLREIPAAPPVRGLAG